MNKENVIEIYREVEIQTEILLSYKKKNQSLSFAIMWMDLEGIMLSEISQRKINTVHFHLHVESKIQMNRYDKTEADLQIEKRISGLPEERG